MLIACKYEEIYPPIVKDFVYITDNAYTKEEILEMEKDMLQTLDFDIQITSSYRFLERYAKVQKVDQLIFNMSRYLLELALVNYKMIKFRSSNLAASSLYLSMKMTKSPSPWNDIIAKHSQYKESEVRPCAKELFSLLQLDQGPNAQLTAVKKKFALPKFCEVSKIKLEQPPQQPSANLVARSINTAQINYPSSISGQKINGMPISSAQ